MKKDKIIIIGSGNVGSATAFTFTLKGLGDEIGIIDINEDRVLGDVLDLEDASVLCKQKKIFKATYEDCKDADIIIITAGVNQKEGETRIDLLNRNITILKDIINNIVLSGFDGIIIMATNPVDIMAYAAYKLSGLPKNKIIGSGTVLDTLRLRKILSDLLNVSPSNVHAYMMGEHGDSEFAIWSNAYISAISLKEWFYLKGISNQDEVLDIIEHKVRTRAYDIINLKGATYYGIALSLSKIAQAILYDKNEILTVSCLLEGEFKSHNVFTGVPAIINKDGIKEIIDLKLDDSEYSGIHKSIKILKDQIEKIDI